MPIIRGSFPESFKREAVEQVIAGTLLRHVAQAIGVTEALLSKWKGQYAQPSVDAFPGQGKHRGEAAELKQLRDTLARVTM
jgi:transposase